MIKVKVRKVGNPLGAILPAEVAARLRVKEGDSLSVTETLAGVQLLVVGVLVSFRAHGCPEVADCVSGWIMGIWAINVPTTEGTLCRGPQV